MLSLLPASFFMISLFSLSLQNYFRTHEQATSSHHLLLFFKIFFPVSTCIVPFVNIPFLKKKMPSLLTEVVNKILTNVLGCFLYIFLESIFYWCIVFFLVELVLSHDNQMFSEAFFFVVVLLSKYHLMVILLSLIVFLIMMNKEREKGHKKQKNLNLFFIFFFDSVHLGKLLSESCIFASNT